MVPVKLLAKALQRSMPETIRAAGDVMCRLIVAFQENPDGSVVFVLLACFFTVTYVMLQLFK